MKIAYSFVPVASMALSLSSSIIDEERVFSAIYTFEMQRELPHRGAQLAVDSCQVVLQVAHLLVIQQAMS